MGGNRLHICQENFLRMLLDGRLELTQQEVDVRSRTLGLDWMLPPFQAAEIAPDYSGVCHEHKDVLIYEVTCNVQRMLAGKGYKAYCLTNSYNNTQVMLSWHGKNVNQSDIEALFAQMREKLHRQYQLEMFIGIGSVVNDVRELGVSAADAKEMLGYKFQYADRGIINIANIVRFRHNSSRSLNVAFERVIGCFQDGNLGKMSVRLNELVEQIRNRPYVSGTSIKRTMVEVAVYILNIASNANVDVNEVLEGKDPYRWILQQRDTPSITGWLMQISARLLESMNINQEKQTRATVRKACDYVEENLHCSDLGLQKVSEYVGLSASYFSQIFKAETQKGLNAYIVERRMERAKVLLRTTKMKNAEIARCLGFTSSSYFSQVFKKQEGISAGEFRRRIN